MWVASGVVSFAVMAVAGDPASRLGSDREHVRAAAVQELLAMGPPGLRILEKALHSSNDRQRWAVRSALGAVGAEAVPIIERALDAREFEVRKSALDTFSYAWPDETDLPADVGLILARGLRDRHPEVRESAARALKRLGPDAVVALPEMTRVVRAGGRLRSEVLEALAGIGLPARALVPDLATVIGTGESWEPMHAAAALQAMGPDARGAIEALRRHLGRG